MSDASKFLNWACAKDIEDFDSDDETEDGEHIHKHNHQNDLHNYQTNGHLAGLEEEQSVNGAGPEPDSSETVKQNGGGYYQMITEAATAAGVIIAAHTPQVITDHLPGQVAEQNGTARRNSVSSISSASSVDSYASALENAGEEEPYNDASSTKTTESQAISRDTALKDKELQKLEDKKRKLEEKLSKVREREINKKSEDSAKEEEALRKAQDKHEQEVKKQEEKYRREVEKLEQKKKKEEKKAEERRRKAAEKDEKTRLLRELEELKAEVSVLRKERQIMLEQVGALQAENTALAAKVGRMGLMEVKDEVGKTGRSRASSLKGLARTPSFRTSGSGEKDKENQSLGVQGFKP